jgi:putative nucleotidyltransferase with HDIG domain
LARRDRLQRLAIALAGVAFIWVVTRGWEPPFAYRTGFVPNRAIVARVPFAVIDEERTRDKRQQAFRETPAYYTNNPVKFRELADPLLADVLQLIEVENLAQVPARLRARWPELTAVGPAPTPATATAANNPPITPPVNTSVSGPTASNPIPDRGPPSPGSSDSGSSDSGSSDRSPSDSDPSDRSPSDRDPSDRSPPDPSKPPGAPPCVERPDIPASQVGESGAAPAGTATLDAGASGMPSSEFSRMLPELRAAFAGKNGEAMLRQAIGAVFAEQEMIGLLRVLDKRHLDVDRRPQKIKVHPAGNVQQATLVPINAVLQDDVYKGLEARFRNALTLAGVEPAAARDMARLAVVGLGPQTQLPETLVYNEEATQKARQQAAAEVDAAPEMNAFQPGRSTIAEGGTPLSVSNLRLLLEEHRAVLKERGWLERLGHSLASLTIYAGLFALCGLSIHHARPGLLDDTRRLAALIAAAAATVAASWFLSHDQWRAEGVPLTLFGLTVAVAYSRELALLFGATLVLLVSLALGHDLAPFIVLVAMVGAAVMAVGRIRTRTRLIYVGATVAAVSFGVAVCVGRMLGQAYGVPQMISGPIADAAPAVARANMVGGLLSAASWYSLCAVVASFVMTGLLPFVERLFDVQTDMSLLELGDPRHPLLQELVRRAPGTYNHSINVASIAESAAEAIGANSLLVRVGAYFHDIGKTLTPHYFVENQGSEPSRHQGLGPAMSTLVIIAHVKDGANLARQHGLPQSIIDFIEQHHGTTLVEYFFRQAAKLKEQDAEAAEPDEASFRYPGPKPQTRETAVLMLADAVESASRTLIDPAPARIENLVRDIARKRLLDDQFSECGLTLEQLHTIEQSLVKSLSAVYHGRVKYPDQPSGS